MNDAETPEHERFRAAFDSTPETMAAALIADLRKLAGPVLVTADGQVMGGAIVWGRAHDDTVQATIAAAFRAAQDETLERAALAYELILANATKSLDDKIVASAPQYRSLTISIANHTKALLGEVPATIRGLKVLPA